ncbi:glycosyltransferase family 1 protein [Streptococcus sp. KCJ4932]|uniref:glycosyltransferase family 1 protein n=1 Tax=Streptococcus sp. KCJ4932 TaxID=2545465 RepID=UPI00105689A9|nr:glycosyltransferase family 1 protein [Streptococcus sp. KCJ4932]TDE68819.1 glycosyltransferase family 1 protein [Streptococcus sp. KCJ4932]
MENSKKFKILTITTSGLKKREGISTIILDYYSYFDKKKYQLDLVASGEYDSSYVHEFEKKEINIKKLPSRKKNLLKYIYKLAKLMKEERYDALYIHGSSAIMSIELYLAKILGCSVRVVHSHNTTCDHKRLDKILRPVFYKGYTKALACGESAGRWLFEKHDFEVIKNGRDISKYEYNEQKRVKCRKKLNLDDSTLAIGHVGNFNTQKNQEFLLRVLKELIKENKKVKMYLMGDGDMRKYIEVLSKKLGLSDYICFTGSISNVPEMLQAMDMMLLPSKHEGLPLVVIEWQIAGLPCIISDVVTRECAYMDYVYFLSLDKESDWKNKIIEVGRRDRKESDSLIYTNTQKNGYDLQKNIDILQKCFLKDF